MTLSGYFMLKSVFGQQGYFTLTFALARLSCRNCPGHFQKALFCENIWL